MNGAINQHLALTVQFPHNKHNMRASCKYL